MNTKIESDSRNHESNENVQAYRHSLGFRNRHFVILIDGTGNDPVVENILEEPRTNIYDMLKYIEPRNTVDEKQIKFYLPGVGTATNSNWLISKLSCGLLGQALPDLDKEIRKIYLFLSSNYEIAQSKEFNDKIYLLGFSRGAFIAYLLAELISKYGILRPQHFDQWTSLWNGFVKLNADERLHEHYFFNDGDTPIDFLGLFDAVPGLFHGEIYARFLKPTEAAHDQAYIVDLPRKVRTAVHILSMNETRRPFKPLLLQNSSGNSENGSPVLEQILMPGVHSDVGGGYEHDLLSKISLLTMIDRIRAYTFLNINFEESCKLVDQIKEDWLLDKIAINDEINSFFWRLLWPKQRVFVSTWPELRLFKHPICDKLSKRLGFFKSEKGKRLLDKDLDPYLLLNLKPLDIEDQLLNKIYD